MLKEHTPAVDLSKHDPEVFLEGFEATQEIQWHFSIVIYEKTRLGSEIWNIEVL
nr:hypothetical protein [Ruegeria sp. Alg231-54]